MAKHKKQSLLKSKRKSPAIQPVDEELRQKKVLPIIAALKSLNENERLSAVTGLISLIEDQSMLHMLLRERLVKIILTNTLSDSNLEIVGGGLRVLRSISLLEGRDPSLYMVRENIKLPLAGISCKVLESLQSLNDLNEHHLEVVSLLTANCLGLISSIILAVGKMDGIDESIKLALFIATSDCKSKLSNQCVVDVFEMIYYTSEASDELLLEIGGGPDTIKQIGEIAASSDSWELKIYGLGTEFNTLITTSEFGNDDKNHNMKSVLLQLARYLKEVPDTEVNSIQVCLELLALGAQTDDLDLVTILVTEARPRIMCLLQIPELKLNCVSVLNNIGWSLNGLEQDWSALANTVILRTMETCLSNQLADAELTSAALGLLGSAIIQNSTSFVKASNLDQLVADVMKLIESLHQQQDPTWEDVTRSLVVLLAMVTGGETIAAKLNVIRQTSQLIFLILEQSADPEAHVDVLNALFDVFSDNDAPYNAVEYSEQGLNERLEKLKPQIKRILKSLPKSEPVKRQQALDALNNLDQFIAYKRSTTL